jgi:hypothetical protein
MKLIAWKPLSIVAAVALLGAAAVSAQMDELDARATQNESRIGRRIAPVSLDMEGKNRRLVGLGSYYVNAVSDCGGCHDGEAGHLSGGQPFGPVFSRNLTPNAAGFPADLTLTEFKQVMQLGTDFKGIDPDIGGNPGLLIVMPWDAYRHGTELFVEAIYEYLTAIPCEEGGPGNTTPRC